MSRASEWIQGKLARDKVLFAGKRRHLTSVEVRGVQMAKAMNGVCTRSRFLSDLAVASAPALIWINEPDLELVARFSNLTPQFLDPINPRQLPAYETITHAFRYLILNTKSTIDWMGRPPEGGWKSWVIPHHHCNFDSWLLPDEMLSKPLRVGYIGEPVHLHDSEAIQAAVAKMGLQFVSFDTWDLSAYHQMDIGIAWTRPDAMRDDTRSNVKLVNFCAFGIPSVVCNYDSYRDVDARLGTGACLIRSDLPSFLDALADLTSQESLRRSIHDQAKSALEIYSLQSISDLYWRAIGDAAADFSAISSG